MADDQNTKVFISYRNIELSRQVAEKLAVHLRQRHYQVFIDTQELKGGDLWQRKIYDNIRDSDVLIALIEEETAASEWVQREVDVARGANVSILPLQIAANPIDIIDAQKKLALESTQFIPFTGSDGDYELLIESVERLSKITRDSQRIWLRDVAYRRRARRAADSPSIAAYTIPGLRRDCTLHLATGDITHIKDVDVLVNSENDYMQMARTFGKASLSSTIRREGSLVRKGRLLEDTVQHELDAYIAGSPDLMGRPIMLGQAIPTRAGHPQSTLVRRNRVRYIFHTATIRVDMMARHETLVPIETDDGISEAVRNCLDLVMEVDQNAGALLPDMDPEPDYQPIRSLVLPLFGTGHGGRAVIEIVNPMLDGITQFLFEHEHNGDLALEHIHLCVYAVPDIPFVQTAMQRRFTLIDG